MAARNAEHEAFVRHILSEIADAQATVGSDRAALAEALNARGVTSRRGRPWSAETLQKFLASPGVKRLGESMWRGS